MAFTTVAATLYGILHDQVTSHLCLEYFTIAHPPVFPTRSPFLLALGWGVIATWWVGLLLGIGLAAAARIGPGQKLGLIDLRRPVIGVMVVSAIAALLSGILGAILVATGIAPVPGGWAQYTPAERHTAFSAAAWAHGASYAFGALGGIYVIAQAVRRRRKSIPRIVA